MLHILSHAIVSSPLFYNATAAPCKSDTTDDEEVYEYETPIKHTWQQGTTFLPLFCHNWINMWIGTKYAMIL